MIIRARSTLHALTLFAVAACSLAWMDPTRDRIAEANRLFKQGKYDDAITKYGESLVDDPDSSLLNFNMGDANYKAGKYAEAINSFARVRAAEDQPKRIAKTAFNVGNAEYRLAAAAEASKPQDALKAYALALAAYRRALGADPMDQDAKFNYEFVTKKIDDLKKRLEEQKKQQDQQQQQQDQQKDQQQQADQQQDQQQQDQQQKDQQQQQAQQDQQQADQQKDAQQKQEQQAAGDQKDQQQEAEQQQAGGGQAAGASGDKKDQMSPQEAAALIDTAKNDELAPEDFARQAQGGVVAEPSQDW